MKPNYERAATLALQTLIDNNICKAPIDPFPFLKNHPGVMMFSFEEISSIINKDRKDIISSCRNSPDAITATKLNGTELQYIVAYNKYLPICVLQKAFARELGHVVLGHDGTLPDDVRTAEAVCFAQHLLFPRPLLNAILKSGLRLTTHVIGSITDCNAECAMCMRQLPPIHVDPELNRTVRNQFAGYVQNYAEYQHMMKPKDVTDSVDLGRYMEGYEE